MDSLHFLVPDGKRPSQKNQLQIQGPRPPPLSIHKDSYKIKKPPKPSLPPEQPHHHRQQPVIIYAVSPKTINVTVSDFMTTVQRLTGVSYGAGDVSPAARMAAVEKVMNSPKENGISSAFINDQMVEREEGGEGVEMGRVPGILSPAKLPPVVQEMYFSPVLAPVADPFGLSVMHGNYGFLNTSPSSGLFSGFVGSPVLSPDIFGQIWNF